MPDEKETQAASMATFQQQLVHLVESSKRTERVLEKLDQIGADVIALKMIAEGNKETFSRLFGRLERVEQTVAQDAMTDAQFLAELQGKASLSEVNLLANKIQGFISSIRGAIFIASIFAASINTAVIGGVAYVITHINSTETAVALLNQRIEQDERSARPVTQLQPKQGDSK